jgi:hypothetical protein
MKQTLLPSKTRSGDSASEDFTPGEYGAACFTIDVSEVSGENPELTLIVEGRASEEDAFLPLAVSPTMSIPGRTRLIIAPDTRAMPSPAEVKVERRVPPLCRVRCEVSGKFTFSVVATVI